MKILKTNTAIREKVGPFLDYEDGVTPKLSLDVTALTCTIKRSLDDGSAVIRTALTLTASGGNNDMIHITDDTEGYYDIELTASNLNFLGRMTLSFMDSDMCLPVFIDYIVVSANVYDSLISGTDKLDTAVVEFANIDFSVTQKASLNASTPTSVGSVTGNVGGNVNGSVASVIGAVASVTNPVTTTSDTKIDNILEDTGTTLPTSIADIPTTAEFEARTLPSADYVVVTDTIAGVTAVTNDVGITQAGADKVWSSVSRTLTSFGTLVADIWANTTRTLSSFGTLVSDVWANATRSLTDKTGYSAQVTGIDASVILEIINTNKARIVDGTITLDDLEKILAAKNAGDGTYSDDVISETATWENQAGDTVVTETKTATTITRTL